MKITLRQLQVFTCTAKHKNITLAADEIAISQAAASMSLSQLESQLGQQLFDRDGKKLVLNDVGRQILAQADSILQSTMELELSVLEPQCLNGHLCIGASSTIANYSLPGLLSQFSQQYPSITFELMAFNTEICIKKLLNFEIDIALVEGLHLHPKIEYKPWALDQLHVFCHPNHPLTRRKNIKPADLAEYPWVLRESASGTRQILESALQSSSLNLNNFMVINSSQAIKNYICHDKQALGCLSDAILASSLKSKKLVTLNIKGWQLERNFYHACYKDKIDSRATQLLIEHLL